MFILPPMRNAPLGFFDSGVGGLTVVRAVQQLLPAEDIVYLGDTARLPYGSKSPETIRQFAHEDVRFLLDRGVKMVVVACNTATAHALPSLQEQYRIPIIGVIEPGVEAVLSDPAAQRIGIIATRGTVGSHAYQHELALRRTGLILHATPAPLLVPLVEEDWLDHPATRAALHTYLDPMLDRGIDTLMLACTHYPLLIPVLKDFLPDASSTPPPPAPSTSAASSPSSISSRKKPPRVASRSTSPTSPTSSKTSPAASSPARREGSSG